MCEPGYLRVAAIVAAFNEAERIAPVLEILCASPCLSEIVVVDDGSADDTADVAGRFPVRVLRLGSNQGKACAMEAGVAATDCGIIFFCDADVRGLRPEIVRETIEPVLRGETDMMIAMRGRKIFVLRFLLAVIPLLGGERALRRELWERVPMAYKQGFMIEAALNFYARYWGKGFKYKVFPGLSQRIKEKKYGLWKGLRARLRMCGEVARSEALLQLYEVPPSVKAARIVVANMAAAITGLGGGMLLTFAASAGPSDSVREFFRQNAVVSKMLAQFAADSSTAALAFAGLLLVTASSVMVALNLRNATHLAALRFARARRVD